MGWATNYIVKLQVGETVQFRPRGDSMKGRINSGQLVTVEPCDVYSVNDIVLCKVRGRQFLHIVRAIRKNTQFLIGNNRGVLNGWTERKNIFGKVTKVE
jgi:hypothetical protein